MPETLTPIRKARIKAGWTIQQVASSAGIDCGNLSRIERGMSVSPRMAESLVDIYHPFGLTEMHILYPERYESWKPKTATAKARFGG